MLFLYVCILYSESLVVLFLSASIASESPTNLRVCVCSVGCGCDQCLQCCCISSLRTQSLFNILLNGECLCSATAGRVVYGLSSGIDPDMGLVFIDPPKDRCLLCLCSSSVTVILIETLLINGTPWWLSPPPRDGKHCSCGRGASGLKLGQRVSGCPWWSWR